MRKYSVWTVLAMLGLAGLVVLVLLTACGTQEVDLSFETIERADSPGTGEYYEDKDPKLVIVNSVAELDMLGNTISPDAQSALRNLDFEQYCAIAVFQGWRPHIPTPQSGVEVQRIVKQGKTITVYALFFEPVEGYELLAMVISPYHIVQIRREEGLQEEYQFVLHVESVDYVE